MQEKKKRLPKAITIFTLVMINVAAVGSVKNWPIPAVLGFSSCFYLLLFGLIFFIPYSLVAAELATGWPKTGGIFVWVKEAFGHKTGFLAIWLLWLENVFWYPTILAFIGSTVAYLFDPKLAENPLFMVGIILVVFWGVTFINFLGMRTSGWLSTLGAFCGTYLPAILIIGLGVHWFFSHAPRQIDFTLHSFFPTLTEPKQLAFLTGLLLSFGGVEMAAVHAGDVKNPKTDFPKALLLSVASILGLSILGILSIAMVVPHQEISLAAGVIQAFAAFVNDIGIPFVLPFMALLIMLGAIGSLSTWIVGPSKGLLAAALNGDLPPYLRKVNAHGMPVNLLILQGVIVSLFSVMFVLMPTISGAFWIATVLSGNLYLVMYLIMFAAAIKLRYKRPEVERAYTIPGGMFGIWFVAGIGFLAAIVAFFFGFFAPEELKTGHGMIYAVSLIVFVLLGCLAPSFILCFRKPNWIHPIKETE